MGIGPLLLRVIWSSRFRPSPTASPQEKRQRRALHQRPSIRGKNDAHPIEGIGTSEIDSCRSCWRVQAGFRAFVYSIGFQRFREFRLVLVLFISLRGHEAWCPALEFRSCSLVGVRAQGARGCLCKAQSQRLQVSLWHILRPPSKYPISIYHNDIWTLWESGFRS